MTLTKKNANKRRASSSARRKKTAVNVKKTASRVVKTLKANKAVKIKRIKRTKTNAPIYLQNATHVKPVPTRSQFVKWIQMTLMCSHFPTPIL
jgi:hypothetical protein